MKTVFCALFISLATLLGREVAKRIDKSEGFYRSYLDFLAELLFAVRYSKETVSAVYGRHDKIKCLDGLKKEERESVSAFLACVGKSDAGSEEIRVLSEKERVERLLRSAYSKAAEKKKCAVLVGILAGIIAAIAIL